MPRIRYVRVGKYVSDLSKDHMICVVGGCEYCTSSGVGMRLHMKSKHGVRVPEDGVKKVFNCRACHMGFGSARDIRDHYRRSGHYSY